MTFSEKRMYQNYDRLRDILHELRGEKFRLACGHHVTFGHYFGNDVVIQNGRHLRIICSSCGY